MFCTVITLWHKSGKSDLDLSREYNHDAFTAQTKTSMQSSLLNILQIMQVTWIFLIKEKIKFKTPTLLIRFFIEQQQRRVYT